jgi:hypothetical protein
VSLLINDLRYPRHCIEFIQLTWSGATSPESAIAEAEELYDYIRVAMHHSRQAA